MKICVAQTRPIKGDIPGNIDNHKKLIELAVSNGADIIVFPELSLTGYEPTLAKKLATNTEDSRFDDFQKISDTRQVIIGVGVPIKNETGICISMILFHPGKIRQTYSKRFLHSDEEGFFIPGQNSSAIINNKPNMALAICYELSVPEHAENASKSGADIYIASVAKSITGIDNALHRLSGIADKYGMTVLMSNCIGQSDGTECAGRTSIWNSKGILIGQLDGKNEGILIIDLDTKEIIDSTIEKLSTGTSLENAG